MALVKASLKVVEGDKPANLEVTFQYNPEGYSVNKTITWNPPSGSGKGKDGPPLEFARGEGRTISLRLFLDDYEPAPRNGIGQALTLVQRIDDLVRLTKPDEGNVHGDGKPRPPRVMFNWGNKYAQFTGVIDRLEVAYQMFHENGHPARAQVTVGLREWLPNLAPQNPTSIGLSSMRAHRVVAGETLDIIAYQELGAASRWPHIADLNDLDDPLAIKPGQYLMIAPLR